MLPDKDTNVNVPEWIKTEEALKNTLAEIYRWHKAIYVSEAEFTIICAILSIQQRKQSLKVSHREIYQETGRSYNSIHRLVRQLERYITIAWIGWKDYEEPNNYDFSRLIDLITLDHSDMTHLERQERALTPKEIEESWNE